jgi:hypothetical protein
MVSEHDEDEQDAQARGGHGEGINGDEVVDIVGEELLLKKRDQALALRPPPGMSTSPPPAVTLRPEQGS